jgi:plastocyanin
MFPANNVWNADISGLPVHPNSANYLANMASGTGLHPDFGSFAGYGIPYNVVPSSQSKVFVNFSAGAPDESDSGPYPIPANPNIESNDLAACSSPAGNGDCHILIVDKDACILYEIDAAATQGPGQWSGFSGAIWSLNSNALRTASWTSGDAAGLPILPGLVRYDEVNAGLINHALRFTMVTTQRSFIYPARHQAGSTTNPNSPPMGLRVRLKAGANLAGLSPQALVIAHAMQKYGLILADNGSNWYISGASDPNFNDDDLHTLGTLHGSDFEVVDTSSLVNGSDSSTRNVNVGQGGTNFVDTVSGTSTTTIPINTTVVWNWVSGPHSTTSGSCSGSCTPDGLWDSGVNNSPNVFMRVFNQVGTYHYYCSVHNSFMQGTVIVTPPSDYALAISNSPQTAFAGHNAVFNGTLSTSNGYSNAVNLSCGAGHPATCNPSPNPQTPTGGGAAFTVTAGDPTAKDYTFNVQGVGTDPGQTAHSQSVTLHVVDFTLNTPAPGTISAVSGTNPATTATASFQVTATGALPATVSLSCPSGLPAGASCNFTPSTPLTFSAAGSQPVTVSITIAASTPAGNYPVMISAAATGAVTKLQSVTLQVIDYSMTAPAAAVTTAVSGGTTITPTASFQVSSNGALPNSVTLSCTSGLPAGASCNFTPSTPITFNAAGSQPVTVSVTVAGATAAGSYNVTISAASTGSVTKTQSLTLQVVDFNQAAPSPNPIPMTQSSVSQPVTFQLAPVNSSGFNAQVALSCSGITGASCSWSPSTPVMVPGAPASVTLVVSTNGAAVGNNQTLTIQSSATVNGVVLSHSQALTVNIAAGGVTTDLSIGSLTVQPDPVEIKGPISINVTAHNTGNGATGVNVNLLFSQAVNVVNATLPAACTVNTGVVTCTVADPFNAGADAPFTVQIIPTRGRNLIITATVGSSSVTDSDMTNNTQPVTAHIRPKPLARRGLIPKMP